MPGTGDQESGSRSRLYKNCVKTSDELRRRRNDSLVELRKAKKDDQLNKRRNIDEVKDEVNDKMVIPLAQSIDDIIAGINSPNENEQLLATQAARKILSKEKDPPIDVLINAGIIPRIVQFLSSDMPPLQFEAAWALTNVASGSSEQTNVVVSAGAIPPLLGLLSSPLEHIAEQAVWALGNIAGDGAALRDEILSAGVIPLLLKLVTPAAQLSLIRNVVWTLSNLCRNKNPPPDFRCIKPALPILADLLHYSDDEVIADTCWAFSYASDGANENIEAVLETGVLPYIVRALGSPKQTILTPALRTIGNIVTGNDSQTDAVIEAGALPLLCHLLCHQKATVQKEASWAVSNIIAGNQNQIQAVIDANILPPLLMVLQGGDVRAQKEACWAFTNLTSGGSTEQVMQMCGGTIDAIPAMSGLLTSRDPKTLSVVLDGIRNLFKIADKLNQVDKLAVKFEECGGLDHLELLQSHESEHIYKQVSRILDDYFSVTENSNEIIETQSSFQL